MQSVAIWRSVTPDNITWHEFDDGFVIFNHRTGNTHLLTPIGAAVLESLLETPLGLDLAALQTRLETDIGDISSDHNLESLAQLLTYFETLGLAEMDSI